MKKPKLGEGCIYSVINLSNNKEYVGKDKSGDPENHRWKHHRKMAAQSKPKGYFHRALKKAGGPLRFKWSIIWCGPIELLNEKEIFYIKKRHTFVRDPLCRGYNLTRGGGGASGFKHSRLAKKMMSVIVRLQYEDQAIRDKHSIAAVSRFESQTERDKQSAIMKLRYKSKAARKKHSITMKRVYASSAARERMRAVQARPDVREALRLSHQKYWAKEESHEKSSQIHLRRYEDQEAREKTRAAMLRVSEKLSASALRRAAAMTPEERSAIGKKGAVTRAAKKGKKCGASTFKSVTASIRSLP